MADDPTLAPVIAKSVRVAIVVLATVAVLQELGVEVTGLIAALGIFGFAIAIGMRTQMSNFFTGIMILILKPYRVGEYIDGERVEGVVESLGVFHTVVVTPEGEYAAVPNSAMWSRSILNLSRFRPQRIEIVASLERQVAFREIEPAIERVIRADPDVFFEYHPQIKLVDVAETTMEIRIAVWCGTENSWDMRERLVEKLGAEIAAMGVTVIRIGPPRRRRRVRTKPTPPPPSNDTGVL